MSSLRKANDNDSSVPLKISGHDIYNPREDDGMRMVFGLNVKKCLRRALRPILDDIML